MAPILYMLDISPPVRGVMLAAKAIGVKLEYKEVDLITGDHLTDAYVKVSTKNRKNMLRKKNHF